MVLQKIDDLLRDQFKAPADPKNWFHGWYNYIGFLIAMGKDWTWLRRDIDGEILCARDADAIAYWGLMRDILDFLQANFSYDAWREIGR